MEKTVEKVREFIPELKDHIHKLQRDTRLAVHKSVDEFSYMTKAEELRFLLERYDAECARLQGTLNLLSSKHEELKKKLEADQVWFS